MELDIKLLKAAIQEITSLLPGSTDMTRHELEETKELWQKVVEGKTLTKVLESGQLKLVEPITFEDITEHCLTEDMQYILRNIIVQLLHDHKPVYGQLIGDTVVMLERHFPDEQLPVRPWRVKLAPSFTNTKDMTIENDFKDLSDLIKKILTGYEFPKDVNHLISKLDEDPSLMDEMFLANHPCTWTSNDVYLYLEKMSNKFKTSAPDDKKTIMMKAKKVLPLPTPSKVQSTSTFQLSTHVSNSSFSTDATSFNSWLYHWISKDRFDKFKKDTIFKEVYDKATKDNSEFQEYPPALQFLFFMLFLFNHGCPTGPERQETGEEGRWIRKVKGELFCLFPCFLSNFVEHVFYKDVIQAAIGGGDR